MWGVLSVGYAYLVRGMLSVGHVWCGVCLMRGVLDMLSVWYAYLVRGMVSVGCAWCGVYLV